MMRGLCVAFAALALAGCDGGAEKGGLSSDEQRQLNDAAAAIDVNAMDAAEDAPAEE